MVANANLFTRDNLASLTKERSNPKFIIGYIYKFKVFKLSPILFFYIYLTEATTYEYLLLIEN